jgi:hypothetical protein
LSFSSENAGAHVRAKLTNKCKHYFTFDILCSIPTFKMPKKEQEESISAGHVQSISKLLQAIKTAVYKAK